MIAQFNATALLTQREQVSSRIKSNLQVRTTPPPARPPLPLMMYCVRCLMLAGLSVPLFGIAAVTRTAELDELAIQPLSQAIMSPQYHTLSAQSQPHFSRALIHSR